MFELNLSLQHCIERGCIVGRITRTWVITQHMRLEASVFLHGCDAHGVRDSARTLLSCQAGWDVCVEHRPHSMCDAARASHADDRPPLGEGALLRLQHRRTARTLCVWQPKVLHMHTHTASGACWCVRLRA